MLALVTADMAAEFRVLPLELDGDGLVLAMADPTDNHAVDEVAFFADRFIVRVVATESAIRDGIERHYGVRFTSPRAADRYGARVAQPAAAAKPGPKSEAPPDRTPNPSPPPPTPKDAQAAKPSKDAIEEQIVLLTKVKYADATPLPMPVPPPDDYEPLYAPEDHEMESDEPILLTNKKPERKRSDTLPGFAQITVPDPPLALLRAARDRDQIAAAVLDWVSLLMRRGAFFVMKKSILIGHDARGVDIEPATVRKLVINVEAPSLFRDVIASRLPYRGPLPETPANRAFAHALGGVSSEVLVMPIAVRDRIIAVLFADGAAAAPARRRAARHRARGRPRLRAAHPRDQGSDEVEGVALARLAGEDGDVGHLAPLGLGAQLLPQHRVLRRHLVEVARRQLHRLGHARRPHRRRGDAAAQERHLAEVAALAERPQLDDGVTSVAALPARTTSTSPTRMR